MIQEALNIMEEESTREDNEVSLNENNLLLHWAACGWVLL